MPNTIGTVGTGITAKALVEFDWSRPSDVIAQVQAAVLAFNQTLYSKISAGIARHSALILTQARLPTDAASRYVISGEKGWIRIDPAERSRVGAQDSLSLPEVVQGVGREPDSPEGYAARVLWLINEAAELSRHGLMDEERAKVFQLGSLVNEAGMKEMWEPDALRGEKNVTGGRAGHEARYGSEFKRRQQNATYVRKFHERIARGMTRMTAYEDVAKECRVNSRTVQRAVRLARVR